jgi:uncharacterized membrane protein YeaQ/YmgE (transglycosylase-associated protein family)
MNPFVWCAVGAAVGWIAGILMPGNGLVHRAETMLVAIFGAFIGGEFLGSVLGGANPAGSFRATSLMLAVAGALGLVALLGMMRKAVGPMRPHKLKKKTRY